MACCEGSMDAVQLLIHYSADVSVADDAGRTPLHWACTNTDSTHSLHVITLSFHLLMSVSCSHFTTNRNRCNKLSRDFFLDVCDPSSSIHHLFPLPHNASLLSRLRAATPFPRLTSRTKKNIVPSLLMH